MTPMKEMVKKEMDTTLDSVGKGYRLCILEDLNGWIGARTRAGITGAFGVSGQNDNGRRVVVFCAERGLCVGNTYFKYRSLHKYTVAKGSRRSGGKEHDRSSAGEEEYDAICAGCEGVETNLMRTLRPPCCAV